MKSTIKLILFLTPILIFTHSSCKNNCKGYEIPPPNYFLIKLQNSQGEDLIGNLYTQDIFQFKKNGTGEVVEVGTEENAVKLGFNQVESGIDYYIDWDENDTDTLSFEWNRIDRECYDSYELIGVKQNNIELNLDNGVILIQ